MQKKILNSLAEVLPIKERSEQSGHPFVELHVGQLELVDLTGKLTCQTIYGPRVMEVGPTKTKQKLTEPNAVIIFYGLSTAYPEVQDEFNQIIKNLPESSKVYEVLKYR